MLRIRAASARELGSSPKTSVALALWTVSGMSAGGDEVDVGSAIDVGKRASNSGANGDADGSAEPGGSALGSPPFAASVGFAPLLPAAAPSPMAAATADVMTSRSVWPAVPASAIWATSPLTRNSVVVDPVDGLVTSYASDGVRGVVCAPAASALLRYSTSAVSAASP